MERPNPWEDMQKANDAAQGGAGSDAPTSHFKRVNGVPSAFEAAAGRLGADSPSAGNPQPVHTHPEYAKGKNSSNRWFAVVIVVALIVLGGLAFGIYKVLGSEQTPKPEPVKPAPAKKIEQLLTNPLTGLQSKTLPDHPAVSVKIPVGAPARPHAGLNEADNVWVEQVEGGFIRYDAVYYTNTPSEVGPIRSARPTDTFINAPLHGVFVCSGGQPAVLQKVKQNVGLYLDEDLAGAKAAFRVRTRRAPYNLFTSIPEVLEVAKTKAPQLKAPAQQWIFLPDEQAAKAAEKAGQTEDLATAVAKELASADKKELVDVRKEGINTPRLDVLFPAFVSNWAWDANEKLWLRAVNNEPLSDAAGKRISATNLVLLYAPLGEFSAARDQAGHVLPISQLEGTGTAIVAYDGKKIEANWTKENLSAPIKLTTKDGNTIGLLPGRTWIEITVPGGVKFPVE